MHIKQNEVIYKLYTYTCVNVRTHDIYVYIYTGVVMYR